MFAKRMGFAALAAAVSLGFSSLSVAADAHVAITQIVEHPALDAVRKGVKDVLAESGYEEGKGLKWSFESAQGNAATAAQIAKKFAGDAPDVIVAIATPSAQTVSASTKTIPVVFSAVTDPVGAKLVDNMTQPGANITGVTDMTPIAAHMALVKRVVPNAKRLGIISNPGEANSVSLVTLIEAEAPKAGMSVTVASATKSGEVLAAARSLVGKVDAIYIPTDNTVVSAFEAVVKVGNEARIPVLAGDTDSVKRGAVAAAGFNYYDIGRQTGHMVVKILKGAKPGDMAVEGVAKTDLYLNMKSAETQGVTLSQDLIGEAKEVIR
ncbi:ABC transporter substrate-binding protein [Magnetovibrio sp.]|uniref:ABC transporter substrate-binding protein n=1 Tax=Magnetovibrio sp. TaxID=2024836 RepID=UPI002F92669E